MRACVRARACVSVSVCVCVCPRARLFSNVVLNVWFDVSVLSDGDYPYLLCSSCRGRVG